MRREAPRLLESRPLVSIVIPCYRYGQYLHEAVSAALRQDGVDLEVIIVDDCSPDDSLQIAQDLATRDTRVQVISHETNKGANATFNDGIAASTGDYVLLISADDVIAPGALRRAVSLMEVHPEVSFVYGGVEIFQDTIPEPSPARETWSVWEGDEWIARMVEYAHNLIYSPEALVRGHLARALRYDEAFPNSSDMLMWLRLASRGAVGRINGPAQALYRRHGENMHSAVNWATDVEIRTATFDAFFAQDGADLPDVAFLRERARHRLGATAMRLAITVRDTLKGAEPPTDDWEDLIQVALRLDPTLVTTPAWRRYQLSASGGAGRFRRFIHARRSSWQDRRLLRDRV